MKKVIEVGGGTEWAHDPVAYVVDPDDYAGEIAMARKVMAEHPSIDLVRVQCVAKGFFVDKDYDLDADNPEDVPVYRPEGWPWETGLYEKDLADYEPAWVFQGMSVMSGCAWLEWENRHGDETLEVTLWV